MFFKIFTCILTFVIIGSPQVNAQSHDVDTLASWVGLNAPTGHEHLATGPLMDRMSGWSVDSHSNMIKTTGMGAPHRVVACALDAASFAITQITDDGFLRLHHIGPAPIHPLWSQFHEGQQLRILTRKGPLVGVSAIANGHFINLHRDEKALIRADDLWIDVGATSVQEVADMGIALLDPVVRHIPPWAYSDEVAGPSAGARIGCATVVAGAESEIKGQGTTTWLLSSQSIFNWAGLSAAIVALAPIDELILLDKGQSQRRNEQANNINRGVDKILKYAGVVKIHILAPKVTEPGALMERIKLEESNDLLTNLMSLIGQSSSPPWVKAAETIDVINPRELSEIEKLLDQLAETSAVYGHEGPIRTIVQNQLPPWAKKIAQSDELGNIWVDVGPNETKATVFIAHMDEVGFEIESIEATGVVKLKRLGGVVMSAWEGQPALLQLDAKKGAQSASTVQQLKGVYLNRAQPIEKRPDTVDAWFGMDGASLETAGVTVGMAMTGYKEGHRMGLYRYSSRGLDDRVGTTALLTAMQEIDPNKLKHRVIFAFSVREEGGLDGATALADRYGSMTKRVYSIDTFVSSDTPLESPHFAYAPLGDGPVLRSIESSGMVRPNELDRNRMIAKSAHIKFQVGLTQGGTDGTAFSYWGAPNAGLSWPGRYSHSPAELADIRDINGLVKLINYFVEAQP
ncbi:MAG: M20/M25/M40 family metallo-hydrolase [Sphingomonadales bacterium]